jgi:hypothetical protein
VEEQAAPVIGVPGVAVTRYTKDALAKRRAWAKEREAELARRLDALKADMKVVCTEGLAAADAITSQIIAIQDERSQLMAMRENAEARHTQQAIRVARLLGELEEARRMVSWEQAAIDKGAEEIALRDAEAKMLVAQKEQVTAPYNRRAEKIERDVARLTRKLEHHRALHADLLVPEPPTSTPPAWFGDALTKALKADFEAHVAGCATCQQSRGPAEVCEKGQYWVKALGLRGPSLLEQGDARIGHPVVEVGGLSTEPVAEGSLTGVGGHIVRHLTEE